MKVVVALPGRTFSGTFLMRWSETLLELTKRGYQVMVSNEFSSFVTFSRMKTLGLDVLRGADQKPFGDKVDYDVWLTIDSDIVFTPEQVIELLEDTKKYPVVSGLYRMQDMTHLACVKDWDLDYFKKNGSFEVHARRFDGRYGQVHIGGVQWYGLLRVSQKGVREVEISIL